MSRPCTFDVDFIDMRPVPPWILLTVQLFDPPPNTAFTTNISPERYITLKIPPVPVYTPVIY